MTTANVHRFDKNIDQYGSVFLGKEKYNGATDSLPYYQYAVIN